MSTDVATPVQSVTRVMGGSLITLRASTAQDLIWSTKSRWQILGHEFGFQAGPRGMEQDAVLPLPGFKYTEEYLLQGAPVILGSSTAYDIEASGPPGGAPATELQWIAAWLGDRYSLITSEFDAPGIVQGLLDRLASFEISETREGIALKPAISDLEFLFESATVELPGIGTVRVYRPSEAASVLPSWGGTPVQGGELFKTHQHLGEDRVIDTYVLANESAVATINPLYVEPGADIAAGLASLRVDWGE